MYKASLLAMGLISFLFGSCSRSQSPPPSRFVAGQVWAFKTPADQPEARLTILRVEDGGRLGTIVHIAISNLSLPNGQSTVQHMPFSESAVEQSVTTLERESGPVPDYSEGYRLWREAYDAGKGGVFTIPVAEGFEAVTSVLRQNQKSN